MSEPFIGEIKIFAGNFAPRNFAFCNGQIIQISENNALFAIINDYYGGDGRITFALPDMRGRIPLHVGGIHNSGPGLSQHSLGEFSGHEITTLSMQNMPAHNHGATFVGETENTPINGTVALNCHDGNGNQNSPKGNYPAAVASDTSSRPNLYPGYSSSANAKLATGAAEFSGITAASPVDGSVSISPTGGINGSTAPFSNMQPYIALNFIIALNGIFPSRS